VSNSLTGRTKRRAVGATNKFWSDNQKIEAVALYLTLGNVALVSATLKIPDQTLRNWRAQAWWNEVANELRVQDNIQFSASAKRIIDKSMEALADRLEHGDWIYDQKTGKLRRKPVSMRDAYQVAHGMIEKKILLDKAEQVVENPASLEEKLNKLMERFTELAEGKKPVEVTDVVYVENTDALHEGRQARLQEGEQTVQQPSGANQSSVGTDSGSEGS